MANTAQKKWMKTIATWCQDVGFDDRALNAPYDFQLHHVVGREGKHNKIEIGHWFIIPLPTRLHDVDSNHSHCVTHHKNLFTDRFGLQSELFMEMIESMVMSGSYLPFDIMVINAIMDTRR